MPISERSVPQGINEKSTRQRFAYSSRRKPEEFKWRLSDRWAWAYGLPVSGIARAVAGCIANHANTETGRCWPGIGSIVKETGFSRRSVIRAIKGLERGGHITVRRFKVDKKNEVNHYQIPPLGSTSDGLGGSATGALGSATETLGGSATGAPELGRFELGIKQQRTICSNCNHSWQSFQKNGETWGTHCHECGFDPTPWTPEQTHVEQQPCTCDNSYRGSSERLCIFCNGERSAAQREVASRYAPVTEPPAPPESKNSPQPNTPPTCTCESKHRTNARVCVVCFGVRSTAQREWKASQQWEDKHHGATTKTGKPYNFRE